MTASLKAPFPYFGGKSRAAGLLWERWGSVPNYVDPFCGSLAPLLLRPHAPHIETVNDADAMICNFWRAVQADPEAVARWADWPVSELDLHARHRWLVEAGRQQVERLRSDPDVYDAKIAGWWVWGICQWIGSGWCQGAALAAKAPHLGDGGRGINRLSQQIPHLGSNGRGGHRARLSEQLPYLAGTGPTLDRSRTGGLVDYMQQLADRLRRVRVVCGNWDRVLGPSVTDKLGATAILLDPPYGDFEHLYAESNQVARDVRAWAVANGANPLLRIALCGYADEHPMPADWECVPWKAAGGYGGQSKQHDNPNARRERIWFSPHCLKPAQAAPTLFDYAEVAA